MVSKTNGRIHFEDLDPLRFEDLVLSIVYTSRHWYEICHYGRTGSDDGIDIFATDIAENGKIRRWYIQCKRYTKLALSDAKQAVNKLLSKWDKSLDNFLLYVACDVRKDIIEKFKEYANSKGIKNAQIITASVIESELYTKRHDLLFAYFGVNLMLSKNEKIDTIKRRIQMKKQFEKDFRNRDIKIYNREIGDTHKYSKVVIHSIDDEAYPNPDIKSRGISSWLVSETFGFYNNGFEVICGFADVVIYEDMTWKMKRQSDSVNEDITHVLMIGRIPYDNIIVYELDGDDYYGQPHIYCDFACNGEPYEEVLLFPDHDDRFFFGRYLDKQKERK